LRQFISRNIVPSPSAFSDFDPLSYRFIIVTIEIEEIIEISIDVIIKFVGISFEVR
jgi:hypothetical protein